MDKLGTSISPDGLVETTYIDEGGQLVVDYQQDAEQAFESTQRTRNNVDVWGEGMKRDFVKAFHIPNGVVMELFAEGLNVYTAPLKDIISALHRINRYDACKLTTKRLA